MNINEKLSTQFSLKREYADNIISLIDEGCTIPFISRYRKEMHNSCDDQVIREFADRLEYLRNLEKRKKEVLDAIESQGKLTDEIVVALAKAETMTEVEDIYRPYKKKKKTRAMVAIEKGLQPLADIIIAQELKECNIIDMAKQYISVENGVETAEDAINYAKDIIAEIISDNAELRKLLRAELSSEGETKVQYTDKEIPEEKRAVYEMYKEYTESILKMPSHRILAMNRGENEDCLKIKLVIDKDLPIKQIKKIYLKDSAFNSIITSTIEDSLDRLIFPSIEREVRNELTSKASEQAIKLFEDNLIPLLMQAPIKDKVVLGFDPGYRTGCKMAVINGRGNVLDTGVIYPTINSTFKMEESKKVLKEKILKNKVDIIAIGNGTASKESEIFVAGLLKEIDRKVSYAMVNESGASVYSASKLAAEEFPDFDLTLRSAISIARRLQDPLAELIKIDVKSIGVGQYQHDMPQKRLDEVLTGVVEDCVNKVGVDLNTASHSLLSYVSGLNMSIAKNIVEYRKSKAFDSRKELLKVPKLGPKAYEQCAGFLRIPRAENVLDNTGVHPEAYSATSKLLKYLGYSNDAVAEGELEGLRERLDKESVTKVAEFCSVGVPTLMDIVDEILKPGRDIRDNAPPPLLREDIMDMNDLIAGMELIGTVRNVIDFGAFIDIGVHQDGLVHLSQICNEFIKHPSEKLKVGDIVKVWVLSVDLPKKRIQLTMKDPNEVYEKPVKKENKDFKNNNQNYSKYDNNNRSFDVKNNIKPQESKEPQSLDSMLSKLQQKFSKK